MGVSESSPNPTLQAIAEEYADQTVRDHAALVAALAPAEMMYVLRWMVPFMNPAERLGMLGDMQRHAPPQAFQAALDAEVGRARRHGRPCGSRVPGPRWSRE